MAKLFQLPSGLSLEENPKLFSAEGKAYTYSDLKEAIHAVGIRAGHSVFMHSDLGHFGTLAEVRNRDQYMAYFIRALVETIGEDGTLMMPTFTYSFCKNEIFDPKCTKSTVGILTEFFRKLPNVRRSLEGIFSVAALGPQSDYFTNVGTNCFGEDSIFDKLRKENATILFLGETFDITYMHHVEQFVNVPYRHFKSFPGEIRIGEDLKPLVFNYFVRDLQINVSYDLDNIARFFESKGILRRAPLGASKLRAVSAQDAFAQIIEGLKVDPHLLIKK